MGCTHVHAIVGGSFNLALDPALQGTVAAGARRQAERRHGSEDKQRQENEVSHHIGLGLSISSPRALRAKP